MALDALRQVGRAAGGEQESWLPGRKSESSGGANAGAGPRNEDNLSFKAHDTILANSACRSRDGSYVCLDEHRSAISRDFSYWPLPSAVCAIRYWPTAQSSLGQARPLCLFKYLRQVVGQAQPRITARRSLPQQPRILRTQIDASRQAAPAG